MINTLLVSFVASVVSWAQPYAQEHHRSLSVEQTWCLTEAVYYESRGEGVTGIAAVAYIVLNRTSVRNKSICDVIHEKGQFSYYNPHKKRSIKEVKLWMDVAIIAVYAQLGLINNPIGNATMYNTSKMSSWLDDAIYSCRINHHYFYVMKKDRGRPTLSRVEIHIPPSELNVNRLLKNFHLDPRLERMVLADKGQ